MKEYLVLDNGEYRVVVRDANLPIARDWIWIPEGAVEARINGSGSINFINENEDYMNNATGGKWVGSHRGKHDIAGHTVVWQRSTHPEELPFIDDEPKSLNDQYAEIEQVRQSIKVKSGSDSDHAADAMSYGIMGLIADTNHARQQSIEATLAERQAQYGNFEDVAFVTENIMSVLAQARVNGLNDLPHTHRMALYMIASKMARIVSGDFNHIDGWHDIAGYAKLVEDTI